MKKVFIKLIAVAVVLSMTFSACKKTHQHSYDTEWSSDAYSHWHQPLCDDVQPQKSPHVFKDNVCTVCGYVSSQSQVDPTPGGGGSEVTPGGGDNPGQGGDNPGGEVTPGGGENPGGGDTPGGEVTPGGDDTESGEKFGGEVPENITPEKYLTEDELSKVNNYQNLNGDELDEAIALIGKLLRRLDCGTGFVSGDMIVKNNTTQVIYGASFSSTAEYDIKGIGGNLNTAEHLKVLNTNTTSINNPYDYNNTSSKGETKLYADGNDVYGPINTPSEEGAEQGKKYTFDGAAKFMVNDALSNIRYSIGMASQLLEAEDNGIEKKYYEDDDYYYVSVKIAINLSDFGYGSMTETRTVVIAFYQGLLLGATYTDNADSYGNGAASILMTDKLEDTTVDVPDECKSFTGSNDLTELAGYMSVMNGLTGDEEKYYKDDDFEEINDETKASEIFNVFYNIRNNAGFGLEYVMGHGDLTLNFERDAMQSSLQVDKDGKNGYLMHKITKEQKDNSKEWTVSSEQYLDGKYLYESAGNTKKRYDDEYSDYYYQLVNEDFAGNVLLAMDLYIDTVYGLAQENSENPYLPQYDFLPDGFTLKKKTVDNVTVYYVAYTNKDVNNGVGGGVEELSVAEILESADGETTGGADGYMTKIEGWYITDSSGRLFGGKTIVTEYGGPKEDSDVVSKGMISVFVSDVTVNLEDTKGYAAADKDDKPCTDF